MAQVDGKAEVVATDKSAKLVGVRDWKIKIAASWKTAAASILAVAKDLVDAEKALKAADHSQWEQLKRELHDEKVISDAIQRKLMFIGRHHAMLVKHAEYLPPRYNAIYHLSHLKEQALTKLVEERKLSPDMEDRDLVKLLPASKQARKKEVATGSDTSIPLVRVIQTKKRLSTDAKALLVKTLKQLGRIEGVELRFTEDGERFSTQDEE